MIKITALFMIIIPTLLTTGASAVAWSKLGLSINEIEHKRGGEICVYVFLKDGFPVDHDKSLKKFCYEATQSNIQIEIPVPNFPFAIKIHHDEDISGTVTKDWTGIFPAEGLGFSSGAQLGFGTPSFDDAVMTLPIDGKISIYIIYP